ncbi:MAG: TIGR02281 family clan AA aspartic protease [Rhodobacteraceae bacterium]|nr:TIGR02281 family clan AA aspartic protease [Paracoccaceae bacterium]
MTGDQFGEALFLVILGGAVLVWFIAQNRLSLGRVAQQALIWVLIFVGVIAAVGVWDDIRTTVTPRQTVHADSQQITVPRSRDGHFRLTLMINDQPIPFLVDTGATQIVLTREDAERAGLDPANMIFSGIAMTANGEVRTAPVRLDAVALGPFVDHRVGAWVNGGELEQSLLGMSYLQRWSSVSFQGDTLVLDR